MQKFISLTALAAAVILPVMVFAAPPPASLMIPPGPQSGQELLNVINNIANWVFAIFLAIAVIFLVVGAFKFMTAQGNEEEITGARTALIYAAVGIALAVLAKGLPTVVRSIVLP